MDLSTLQQKIENKTAKLAIIGLGYVGLPVACEFARVGFDVLGVEIIPERVDKINQGISPIEGDEPGLAELLESVVGQKKLRATADYDDLRDRDVILIDVETPIDENKQPLYQSLRAVLRDLGPVLKDGSLVIVESTIAPRTMQDLVLPLLEEASGKRANRDFYLGNCPERVMPGKLLRNLRTLSRVVGGMTPETANVMVSLYHHVVDADLDPTDCLTAELVKTTENAYRDVNIAFANEIALICETLGGDVWKVRELVNKSPGRDMLLPGAGVGGHCIPKDPWLLIANLEDGCEPSLIPAARGINDDMPRHMLALTTEALSEVGVAIEDAKVAILGYAYLENSDDTRNSPSAILVGQLDDLGTEVVVHDPWIPAYQGDLKETIQGCDALVIMVAHDQYRQLDWTKLEGLLHHPILVDGRHVITNHHQQVPGFLYRGVGQ